MTAARVTKQSRSQDYPSSDGKPMAESDLHRDVMFEVIEALRHWFADREDVYVAGNLLVFFEPGNRRRHVSPDAFVVRGVPGHRRENYLIWEEGRGPEVVIEVSSSTTRRQDTGRKMELYRDTLGVREYFLFDPREEYLAPSMQGYRLRGGRYVRIHPVAGRLPSQVLGLHLEREGEWLRFHDPVTETRVLTRAQAEHERAEAEHERAQAEHERAEAEHEQAQAERERAEAEHERAEAERERAEMAERRAEELQRELERLRSQVDPSTDQPGE